MSYETHNSKKVKRKEVTLHKSSSLHFFLKLSLPVVCHFLQTLSSIYRKTYMD